MNNYNNYQPPMPKKKKGKSGSAAAVIISILILVIVGLSCTLIYFRVVEGYELKIEEYENLLQEYQNNLNELSELIKSDKSDNSSIDSLSSLSAENNMPYQNQNSEDKSESKFDAADIASRTAAAVIGVKVEVPAQNINSFWQTRTSAGGSGSGIIISQDGYIVTNYHVVEDAIKYSNAIISVVFIDGEEHIAKYIGGDEINDLAVIKIDTDNLQYATLGSSNEAKVGDYVIAIGNPLGVINLYGSVTFGIISGVNRKIETENVAEELIQTDAAINPGNSGGALINSKGEVIGINTIKIASSDYEGLGFAIPIDYAKPLIESIMEYGYIKGRPTLGISEGIEISRTTASWYRVPQGILVASIDSNSNAAGIIQEDDIITKINGENVYSMTDINNMIKTLSVGESVTITIYRNGGYGDLSVKLSEKR